MSPSLEASREAPLIGVLALQGDVEEHVHTLTRLGATVRLVKRTDDLAGLDGIILPGGESTTIGKLLRRFEILKPLSDAIHSGLPTFGTCAGMILVANTVLAPGSDQPTIGGVDIAVERNGFGSQVESFETELEILGIPGPPVRAVFIRAPIVRDVGDGVKILAALPNANPVVMQQGNVMVASFHPELTNDLRLHRLFLDLVESVSSLDSGNGGGREAVHLAAGEVRS